MSEMNVFPIHLNLSHPLPASCQPTHTAMLRSRSVVTRRVLAIRGLGRDSQIGATAVEPISADVIALAPISDAWESKQLTVQKNVAPLTSPGADISGCVAVSAQIPMPPIDEVGINDINQDVRSGAAIFGSERYPNRRLTLHRDLPLTRNRGATPPAVSAARGFRVAVIIP